MDESQGEWVPALWRRLDLPGYESCRVRSFDAGWEVAGAAVLAYDGSACQLGYRIV